jgi:hypothetical protein
MIKVVEDNQTLLRYWEAEQKMPRWYLDTTRVKSISKQAFLEFCEKCHIYEINDNALLYCESPQEGVCNIHFSLMRGSEISVEDLVQIKRELLQKNWLIFGWVARQNRGLQQLCRDLGLSYSGVQMMDGVSHGRVIQWLCYSISYKNVLPSAQNLLSFA